jgi:hypothetical protein
MFRVLASVLFLIVLVMPAESFSLRRRGEVSRSKTVVDGGTSFSRSATGRQSGRQVGSPEVHVQLEPVNPPVSDGGFFESFGAGMPVEGSNIRSAPLPPSERRLPSDRLRNPGYVQSPAPVVDSSRSLPSDNFLSVERPAFSGGGGDLQGRSSFSGREGGSRGRSSTQGNQVPANSRHKGDVSSLPYRGQFYGSSPALFELDPGLVQRWDMLPELRPSMDAKGPGM